jgi:hypothetical protein
MASFNLFVSNRMDVLAEHLVNTLRESLSDPMQWILLSSGTRAWNDGSPCNWPSGMVSVRMSVSPFSAPFYVKRYSD